MVTASVTANSRNSRPTTSPMNSSGISTAISDTVSDMMVKPICAGALQRRLERRLALLDVARDVLDHHDRVVDHEAGGDGQRHQRQVVEAVAQQVHHAEGADQRQRHRQAGDDGRAAGCAGTGRSPAPPARTASTQLDLARRAPRRGWSVVRSVSTVDLERRPAGAPCSSGSSALIASTVGDDVGAGLALDVDDDRRRRVRPRRRARCSPAPSTTVATSRQPHRRAVPVGDDQVRCSRRRSVSWSLALIV